MYKGILLWMAVLVTGVGAEELRVATFNIRYDAGGDRGLRDWKARQDLVMETVAKMNPDILGVQEALHHQKNFMEQRLPDHAVVGIGRDDGKTKGEYSPVFYRKDYFDADPKEQGTFWLSATPEVVGSKTWGNEIPRICTWVRLLGKNGRGNVYVYNTHWDHRSQPSREKAGTLMLERIRTRTHQNEPVVVLGDFNATETNKAMLNLLAKSEADGHRLRCAFIELHPDEENRRTGHGYSGSKEGRGMIDHVVVDHHWQVRKAWIEYHKQGEQWPSDHFPVAAVISLAAAAAE